MRRRTSGPRAAALLVLSLGLAVGSAGGASASESPRDALFRLADGARWTYRSAAVGTQRTMTLERGATGLVVEGFPGAGPLRIRAIGETIQVWDARDRRWEALLRLGARVGSRHRVALGAEPFWDPVVVEVASREARTRALGRVVRSCVRLTLIPPPSLADAGVLELWFAPGLGLVRFVEQTIAGPRAWTLASRRAGG